MKDDFSALLAFAILDVKGFEHWGHVVTANEHYTQLFDGVSVKMLIDNWLAQDGKTMLIKH